MKERCLNKFRGIRSDNNEFVFGQLLHIMGNDIIIKEETRVFNVGSYRIVEKPEVDVMMTRKEIDINEIVEVKIREVPTLAIEESYIIKGMAESNTGFFDSNYKNVYVNDILKDPRTGFKYLCECVRPNFYIISQINKVSNLNFDMIKTVHLDIIGNTHENPELLTKEVQNENT